MSTASAWRRVAVFANNDGALRTVGNLKAAGLEVAGVFDTRLGDRIVDTRGRKGLRAIVTATGRRIEADCLAVSGGWSPNVHLTCHHRGRPVWSEDIRAFVPGPGLPSGMTVAGAANGALTLAAALREGHAAGAEVAAALGREGPHGTAPSASDEGAGIAAFWHVSESRRRAWIDLQNDVTVTDLEQAHREGFRSVKHLKRYTTLGMATD